MKAVLSIAGSDSSGGAGIQADIKTIASYGLYAETVITAITAQNTCGVRAVQDISPEVVGAQIDAVFEDIRPDAVKIGMVSSAQIINVIAERLRFHQARNVMELIEMLIRRKQPEDQIAVHLVTAPDDGNIQEQRECLDGIAEACTGTGVDFTWAFDGSGTLHARDITTDTGWKMVLDRGLDIFQPTPRKMNGFSLGERMQEHRMVRGFYVTYVENL